MKAKKYKYSKDVDVQVKIVQESRNVTMPEEKSNGKTSASLNGESDLEGKSIIDSRGEKIGVCKAVSIGSDGQVGLSFEVEINGKLIIPSQTIPYSAISKITDVIELNTPINIKIAQSSEEVNGIQQIPELKIIEESKVKEDSKVIEVSDEEPKEQIKSKSDEIATEKSQIEEDKAVKASETRKSIEKTVSQVNIQLPIPPEKLIGKVETIQADATAQLSKALSIEEEEKEHDNQDKFDVKSKEQEHKYTTDVKELTIGLKEAAKKIQELFDLIDKGDSLAKIEALIALTDLIEISPELGLSLLPKLMTLSEESQQDVRLAVAKNLEKIGETKPELFKGYFLEILQNAYDEPLEEIRDQLIKMLHDTAIKIPEIASQGLEEFLEDVIIGKRVPEVPSKVIHDTTSKVVSGNFLLTRTTIKAKLKFVAEGGKLGERNAEELEDYNATLIGLTIIESFTTKEAEKIVKSPIFKNLGPIFVEVIQQMINAYKEGSFKLLSEVVDKKIEIPITVIEKFYEIKISKTLEGAINIPLEVFLENAFVNEEEAEQIIYRLVMQKRVNAAITMNNGKTFISALDHEILEKKETTKIQSKPKTSKESKSKSPTSTEKKENSTTATTTTKKTTSQTKTKSTPAATKTSTKKS